MIKRQCVYSVHIIKVMTESEAARPKIWNAMQLLTVANESEQAGLHHQWDAVYFDSSHPDRVRYRHGQPMTTVSLFLFNLL